MCVSPLDTVNILDNNRPDIIMQEDQWFWSKITWPVGFKLNYGRMPGPTTKKLILLLDYRGGVDGRVWLVCTLTGSVGVIKFAQGKPDSPFSIQERLQKECDYWWLYDKVYLLLYYLLFCTYIKSILAT
jgi:hypothetical protein